MAGQVVQQVAQAAQTAQTSWVALVASSAVIGAVAGATINTLSNWLLKLLEAWRERRKEIQRVAHVKLEIMDQLESFANRCANFMYDIHEGLDKYYRYEENAFSNVPHGVPLKFDPEPQWAELPVPFVAPIKALTREYSDTGEWINRSDLWAGIDEQYGYELERVAFYGLAVLKVADRIRREIKAGNGGALQLDASRSEFEKVIEQRRERYLQLGGDITLIPELEALFERQTPDLKSTTLREKKAKLLL
ncbi:TPA: hypothetical protein QDC27_001189 [Burkholderia cepacia ATCC 25416]|uniref:hypothetical protein n=1 Tax=Burkholderia cepacia TaxID=292 RepID=UPI001591FAA0|nr:hypothetical protein [Burkholderia cepacia]HDR9765076.1 hypothetical protein [Burkholderia cepacia ATCC 25416]MCA8076700.1 hypothetical protein [Burkholderia cepacia]MDW9233799.1 hypothetical protein [Burkholderia cepacia]HDR9773449.1 hypothetical protein [Burkholderia cepacia ATCC 25416]HDR9780514.1 hypothetical protein [Burkholderia cepacia ATCC 25416]